MHRNGWKLCRKMMFFLFYFCVFTKNKNNKSADNFCLALVNQAVVLFWIRYQVTGNISTVSHSSLTHCTKSHATFSTEDPFRKILNDKSEISFNHVYFKQTRSPSKKVFAPSPPPPPPPALDKISCTCIVVYYLALPLN